MRRVTKLWISALPSIFFFSITYVSIAYYVLTGRMLMIPERIEASTIAGMVSLMAVIPFL